MTTTHTAFASVGISPNQVAETTEAVGSLLGELSGNLDGSPRDLNWTTLSITAAGSAEDGVITLSGSISESGGDTPMRLHPEVTYSEDSSIEDHESLVQAHLDVLPGEDAYYSWEGWELTCCKCNLRFKAITKSDALGMMQEHYIDLLGEAAAPILR